VTPGETLHVVAGLALTVVYAVVYQWRHWVRVRPFRRQLHYALGLIAALFMAATNLTGLWLGALWLRDRVIAPMETAVRYPPLLGAVHNVASMVVLTFVGAHVGAVLLPRPGATALVVSGGSMSETSSVVTAEHFRYVAERTTREDSFLKELKAAATADGIPSIWIAPEQASFMQILLRIAHAREVVEIGTLAGYSAIAMARALPPEGRVRTIELETKHADFAERWVARSDVAGRVEVHRGAGHGRAAAVFAADSADAAFLDADKASYPNFLTECLRIVRRGGLIMVDNAFAFGELFAEKSTDREVRRGAGVQRSHGEGGRACRASSCPSRRAVGRRASLEQIAEGDRTQVFTPRTMAVPSRQRTGPLASWERRSRSAGPEVHAITIGNQGCIHSTEPAPSFMSAWFAASQ
jgi:predicted O-methyltransferase YrrM